MSRIKFLTGAMLLGLWACTPEADDSLTTTPVDPDDCLVKASGTSAAAPHVAALLLIRGAGYQPEERLKMIRMGWPIPLQESSEK